MFRHSAGRGLWLPPQPQGGEGERDTPDRGPTPRSLSLPQRYRNWFPQGHEVGELAKRLYPDGIHVPDEDFGVNLHQTRELLVGRRPLFEAGFMANSLYARIDILRPAGGDEWDIVEVKSTTGVKDAHLPDLAFQKHCCQLAGLTINRCYLAHINKEFVKSGNIIPDEFFVVADVTEEVRLLSPEVQERAREMLRIMGIPK